MTRFTIGTSDARLAARSTATRQRVRSTVMLALSVAAAVLAPLAPRQVARAQWVTVHESFYYPADHNWSFRRHYQSADRLFNAFDYGHAILYELLWTRPDAPASLLEEKEYRFITETLLASPPRLPVVEEAIAPKYAQLAPEAKAMFEWAHVLHRQLYDVLGDPRMEQAEKDREVRRLLDHYFSRPDLAFSRKPKSMALMQEQPYSLAFRQGWPTFNGLIWAYHWLQVGLYEPLVVGRDFAERQAMVEAAVARFRQMLLDPPSGMPHQMPMTPAIAPTFAARYPEAAIVFDNLHSMHDVISDILANPAVPRDRKRAEILLAAERFRDDTTSVITQAAWLAMAQHMGIENQGGPAVGFMPELPSPTVTYGAVMQHDPVTGAMVGMAHGEVLGGAHAGHGTGKGAATPHVAAHRGTSAMSHPGVHDAARDTIPQVPRGAPRDSMQHAGHAPELHARHHGAQADTLRRAVTDSAFAELQARGMVAMGVDQYASRHVFESRPDGGRIDYRTAPGDTAGARTIRAHLREIRDAFARGDFSIPAFVHDGPVPGTDVMAARREHLHYRVEDVDGGAILHITTHDAEALRAVHTFLAFQRQDHRTGHQHDH